MPVHFRHRPYSSVKEILVKPDGFIVKLWGWVDKVEAPYKVENEKGERVVKSKATIRDSKSNFIGTTELSGQSYEILSEMQEGAEPVELLCQVTPVEIGSGKWRNKIHVYAIKSGVWPLSRIEPLDRELKIVENYISSRKNNGFKLFDELRETVCEYTSTVLIDKNSPYLDFINFIILQGVSGGFLGKTSGKLHSCAIGPPGVGKGHLVEIIKLVNPIFEESHVQRVTETGITGSMTHKGGIWGVIPLKLPNSSMSQFTNPNFPVAGDAVVDIDCDRRRKSSLLFTI